VFLDAAVLGPAWRSPQHRGVRLDEQLSDQQLDLVEISGEANDR